MMLTTMMMMKAFFYGGVVAAFATLMSVPTALAFQPTTIDSPSAFRRRLYRTSSRSTSSPLLVTPSSYATSSLLSSSQFHDLQQLLLADSVTSETYNALNGVMEVQDSTTSDLFADPAIALAATVAAIALIGITATQLSAEEGEEAQAVNKKVSSSASSAPSSSTSDDGGGTNNAAVVIVADEESTSKDSSIENNPDSKNVDVLTEEKAALQAFDEGNRSGLLSNLSRMGSFVRSTRRKLSVETKQRQDVEKKLKAITEEMLDLEDMYELEQNSLQKTSKDLDSTRSALSETEKKLMTTKAGLQNLEEERQSLRKLGRQAWRVSKGRVQNRVQKIRGKLRLGKEEEDDEDNKEEEG